MHLLVENCDASACLAVNRKSLPGFCARLAAIAATILALAPMPVQLLKQLIKAAHMSLSCYLCGELTDEPSVNW